MKVLETVVMWLANELSLNPIYQAHTLSLKRKRNVFAISPNYVQ